MSLPSWPGADHCYSKAYRLLESMARNGHVSRSYNYYRGGRYCTPSQDMKDLIDALDKGDEEAIKAALLYSSL